MSRRRWLAARRHDAPRHARTVRLHTRRLRMPERQRMTTRLKTLFQRPELFVLAGGINPIGAKMAEALGYDAFARSGQFSGRCPTMSRILADPGLRGCRHRLR